MKDKLKKIINESSISDEQKTLWFGFINLSDEQTVTTILEVVEGNPEDLEFLTKNLGDKMKVISSQDSGGWKKITSEEADYLGKI